MVFDGRNGGVPQTMRNVLLRMGWQEFNKENGHRKSQINLVFAKRPKIGELQIMFDND